MPLGVPCAEEKRLNSLSAVAVCLGETTQEATVLEMLSKFKRPGWRLSMTSTSLVPRRSSMSHYSKGGVPLREASADVLAL